LTREVVTAIIGIITMAGISRSEEGNTTIQVKKTTAKKLQDLATKWGDTYDAVIDRLLNGNKPEEKEKPRGDG